MIELHLDLKFRMEPWKKALAFSFICYLIVLVLLIVVVTIIKKDIGLKIMSVISVTCLAALILGFLHMYNIFKYKYLN